MLVLFWVLARVEASELPFSFLFDVWRISGTVFFIYVFPCLMSWFSSCVIRAGILLGIAVRTGSPLNLSLAEPVWKQFAGMVLSVTDLNEIDKDYVPGEKKF